MGRKPLGCVIGLLVMLSGCVGSGIFEPSIPGPALPSSGVNFLPDCQKLSGPLDYRKAGPFSVEHKYIENVHLYIPGSSQKDCHYPLVAFSNGTGARCAIYRSLLAHMATWGMIVACHEAEDTGGGLDCLKALSVAMRDTQDVFLPRIGSTGHSQGGGGAIACAIEGQKRPEWASFEWAVAAIEPAHGMNYKSWRDDYPALKAPVFMFSGSRDRLVPQGWVEKGYQILTSEKYFYEALGASHLTFMPWAESSVTSFFRWRLVGDTSAKAYFLNRPKTTYWRSLK